MDIEKLEKELEITNKLVEVWQSDLPVSEKIQKDKEIQEKARQQGLRTYQSLS